MKNRATIAYMLLVGTFAVSSLPAAADDCSVGWRKECGNGACYTWDQECDKTDDCGNNKDEEWCSYNAGHVLCTQCKFTCHDQTRCITLQWLCDGQNDCPDGSDEMDCPETKETVQFMCYYGRTRKPQLSLPSEDAVTTEVVSFSTSIATSEPTSATLSEDAFTDEATSMASTPPRDCSVGDGDFPCMDGRCLLPVQVCDGVQDCSDGADEGRFCQLVGQGNQPQYQLQPQQQHGLRGWLANLHLQCRVLTDQSLNSSNATKKE